MSEAVITLKGVQKSYGKHQVLRGVDLQVNKGDIYGLVGRNGAGKTTIFKIILGLSEYQAGELMIGSGSSQQEIKHAGNEYAAAGVGKLLAVGHAGENA